MAATQSWIPSTEVAFIAELSDKDIHRAVDEDVLPLTLYERKDGRRFTRVAAVFAKFYFYAAAELSRPLRIEVIDTLTKRLMQRPDREALLALDVWKKHMDWSIQLKYGSIDLQQFVELSKKRVERLRQANRSVAEDPAIMGGMPVFAGTRIPLESVLASKNAGMSLHAIAESYPSLTPSQIEDAEVYLQVHPRRGRPRKLGEANPVWKGISHKVIPPPKPAA